MAFLTFDTDNIDTGIQIQLHFFHGAAGSELLSLIKT